MDRYDLIIFDLDGTLSEFKTGKLLPGVVDWFEKHAFEQQLAIATNQGGVGLRYWMEKDGFGNPAAYPTEESIRKLVYGVINELAVPGVIAYICFAYQSKKGQWGPIPPGKTESYEWNPNCRKPKPGLLELAIKDAKTTPETTLMVGDRREDELAAQAAGCAFAWADDFFGRESIFSKVNFIG